MTAGLVVAGGYSTRFGLAEKALVEVGGEPMLSRIVQALEAVVDNVVIDCRDEQVTPFQTALSTSDAVDSLPTFAVDEEPDAGPIAGLANGLAAIDHGGATGCRGVTGHRERADADEVVVVSCDRPGITPNVLAHLRERRRYCDVDVALPAIGGFLQPLCGAYRTDALADAVAAARETGERRLVAIPRSLSSHLVTERSLAEIVDPTAIESVDTPLDARLRSPAVGSLPPTGYHAEDGVGADDPAALSGD